ncbi:MDR family MFS transporter [Amycolatopsis sp. lyj-90]|uniref:MDR family MFS transporter n=1 Tax=Amycolatopsis sp. lyj-90 TaxID=2789285 RepID=UPI00397D8799
MSKLRGNPWAVLITVCLGFFMTILDTTIVNIAIPDIQSDLGAGLNDVLWVVSAYVLALAVLVITAGRLGDVIGPRKVFLAGMIVFTLASAACGMAQEPWQLIAARVAQGVGGALITPQTLVIMMAVFPPEKRGAASAIWGVSAGLAGVAGPTLGGLLVSDGGWRWIFYVNLPIGVATIVAAVLLIPDVRMGEAKRLDLLGVLLAGGGLGAVTFGLLEGERHNWGQVTSFLTIPMIIGAGLVLLVLFVLSQHKTREPLMPLRLFADRTFSLMSFVVLAVSVGLIGLSLSLTIYLQSVLNLSASSAGLMLAPTALAMMVAFPVVGKLIDKVGGKPVLITGLLLYSVSLVGIGVTAQPGNNRWLLLIPLVLAGISQAAAFAPIVALAMRDIADDLAGAASGAFNAIRQIGFLLAVAVVGAVLESRIAAQIGDEVRARAGEVPSPYRDSFVELATHADGGRITAPADVPADVATQMGLLARSAYGSAFTNAALFTLLGCAAVIALALLVSVNVKKVAPSPAEADGKGMADVR